MEATTSLAGRYRILGRLGEGGMSVVWRAHDDVLDRVVAIKVLASDQTTDPDAPARVLAEARAAAALTHPNVAAVHDFGQWPGPSGHPVPYVVMELVDGRCLTDLMAGGQVAPVEAMRVCADIAQGLAAAHARGLVHHDIKPGNVIVTPDGAKLVDFGLAASIGAPDEADDDGIMYGTPAYLAPERLEGGVVVPGSDVYALGLLLYRLLTGVMPWSAQTTTQMLRAHVYLPPQPLPRIDGVPTEAVEVCRRCLAKDPADRPPAAEVAAVLARAAGRVVGRRPRGDRWRRPVLAALAVVLVAAAALMLARPLHRSDRLPVTGGAPSVPSTSPIGGPGDVPGGGPSGRRSGGPDNGSTGGTAPGPGAGAGAGSATSAGPPDNATAVPGATTATTTDPPDPTRREVITIGGIAVVVCLGNLAQVVLRTPAIGYEVQSEQPGPGTSVLVKFRSGNSSVTIRARCANGLPEVSVT